MPVYVLSGIKSAVIVSLYLFSDRYLRSNVADRCECLHDGGSVVPFGGDVSGVTKCKTKKGRGHFLGHLTVNMLKTLSRSITCQLELNTSLMTAF